MANKTRKTEERRKGIDDINAVIQQIYRDQDLTQGEGEQAAARRELLPPQKRVKKGEGGTCWRCWRV